MKHFLLSLLALACAVPSMAQLSGNGYYRVHNFITKRYVYVTDDKGELDYQASTADMDAIQLWKNFDKAACDPATICFIEKHGDKYDIKSQGTGVYQIIDSYVSIRANQDGTFYAYGSKDGITKYLSDGEQANIDRGKMSDSGKGNYRKWYIDPIGTGTENYFGIKPTMNNGGRYYTSFYTAFPYSFASNGMKAFYIFKVIGGYAVMREIKGTVPAYTPVIVEMSSDQPVNNKLNIGGSASKIGDNALKGVFFNNPEGSHRNQTAYNASTMRLLGVNGNGKLAFITSNEKFIPANHAYLSVAAGAPAELTLITEDEYEQLNNNKPESISLSETHITVVEGNKHQLKATVLPESAFDKSVTWVTNNPAIALIDNNGLVTGVKAGVVNVTAATRNGLMAACEVVVKEPTQPDGVILSEKQVKMTVGETHQLTATVTPDNAYDKSVVWGSYDKSKATIDNHGMITAHSAGVVRVFAQSVNGIQSFCEVVIKDPVAPTGIVLSETHIKMFRGQKHKLTATVTPDDAYDKRVFWGSNDKSIAIMDEDGVITALKEGVVRVLGWTVNDIKAYCEVVITKEVKPVDIKLDRTNVTLKVGEKVQLKATVLPEDASDKSVTWSVDNDKVATVDQNGLVSTVAAGKAVVTVLSSNGLKAKCHITVENIMPEGISLNVSSKELLVGDKLKLVATVTPDNAFDKSVTWSSANASVASVDAEGNVCALAEGKTVISAKTCNNLVAKCEVSVKTPFVACESISLDKEVYDAVEGYEFQLKAKITPDNATIKVVEWSSDNAEVASVDKDGKVKALKAGNATITVKTTDGSNLSASCKVSVKVPVILATSISLDRNVYEAVEGSEFELKATILPEDVSVNSVKWSSSDTETGVVDNGLVKVLKEGTVTISAATIDGTDLKDECIVTVLSGIDEIFADDSVFPVKVFNTDGSLVMTASSAADLHSLVRGIYLIGGKKIIIL